jgi:hypothetical protein
MAQRDVRDESRWTTIVVFVVEYGDELTQTQSSPPTESRFR